MGSIIQDGSGLFSAHGGRVLTVGSGGTYSTLAAALAACGQNQGIILLPGTHTLDSILSVPDGVTISGVSWASKIDIQAGTYEFRPLGSFGLHNVWVTGPGATTSAVNVGIGSTTGDCTISRCRFDSCRALNNSASSTCRRVGTISIQGCEFNEAQVIYQSFLATTMYPTANLRLLIRGNHIFLTDGNVFQGAFNSGGHGGVPFLDYSGNYICCRKTTGSGEAKLTPLYVNCAGGYTLSNRTVNTYHFANNVIDIETAVADTIVEGVRWTQEVDGQNRPSNYAINNWIRVVGASAGTAAQMGSEVSVSKPLRTYLAGGNISSTEGYTGTSAVLKTVLAATAQAKTRHINADYTTDGEHVIYVDSTNGPVTVTLADADRDAGRYMLILDWCGTSATNNITIVAAGAGAGGQIDGAASYVIAYNSMSARLFSETGATWVTEL